jgi:molecular chaperone HtpG
LQTDPLIKKISSHIVKKVADKLVDEHKKDKEAFEKNWDDISLFVKFGMMNDEKFYEASSKILLFKSSSGGYISLEDYWAKNKEKNDNKVFYAPESEANTSLMDLFKSQDLEAILVDSRIDTHFLQFLEGKNTEMKFQRVDSDIVDQVVDKEAKSEIVDSDNKTESDRITDIFTSTLGREGLTIKVENLKSQDVPAVIILPEYMRRISEMNLGMNQDKSNLFKNHTLLLNAGSGLVKNIAKTAVLNPDKAKDLCKQVYDLALLSSKVMSETEIGSFVKKNYQLLEELTK